MTYLSTNYYGHVGGEVQTHYSLAHVDY